MGIIGTIGNFISIGITTNKHFYRTQNMQVRKFSIGQVTTGEVPMKELANVPPAHACYREPYTKCAELDRKDHPSKHHHQLI